jgi:hypothetical protein
MDPISLDGQFSKWATLHRKEMGQEYEEKYDLARAAFEAGYKLAVKDINFFDTLVVPTKP